MDNDFIINVEAYEERAVDNAISMAHRFSDDFHEFLEQLDKYLVFFLS